MKKADKKLARLALRDAMCEAGIVAAWTMYVLLSVVMTVTVLTFVAGGVMPWCMVTLAGGLGVSADTSMLDLVFVYGASGLFVVGAVLVLTMNGIRAATRELRVARDWVIRRLRPKNGEKTKNKRDRGEGL